MSDPEALGNWRNLSAQELNTMSTAAKVGLIAARAQDIFDGTIVPHNDQGNPPKVTRSQTGRMRIRALVPDPEARAGYFAGEYYVGVLEPDARGAVYLESLMAVRDFPDRTFIEVEVAEPEKSAISNQQNGGRLNALSLDRGLNSALMMLADITLGPNTLDYDRGRMPGQFIHPDLRDAISR